MSMRKLYEGKIASLTENAARAFNKGDNYMGEQYVKRAIQIKDKLDNLPRYKDAVQAVNNLEPCKAHMPIRATAIEQKWTQFVAGCYPIAVLHDEIQYEVQYSNKEEKQMYSIEHTRIEHLSRRLHDLFYTKKGDLRKQFHMDDDRQPKDAIELIERIQAGSFVMPTKESIKQNYSGSIRDQIVWRSEEKDEEGYEAAKKDLTAKYEAAKDIIMVKSADEGLAALQDFQA